jgi:predicted transposase YbfD/YdcC
MSSLYAQFQTLTDLRHNRGRRYEAATVLVLLLLAKLAGQQTLRGAAQWVRLRAGWLEQVLGLRRLPCANTYAYICSHLDAQELNLRLGVLFAQLGLPFVPGELVQWAIDGKVLRGTHRESPVSESGQELLHVYAVAQGYLEYVAPISAKGYEAAAAQAFVAQTDCTGKLLTADALHTRPRFCRQIRQQQGHYLLLVKRNRPELEAEIRHLFALPPDPAYPLQTTKTVDSGHGRLTIRRLSTSSELNLALATEWRDVAQVFVLERWVTRHGRTTYESVCGLTSLPPDAASPAQLLAWVRAHWCIENRCHWRRDATLREDASTIRNRPVAIFLAALNSVILALLDHLAIDNARDAMRTFDARPYDALALLMQPL